MKTAISVPDPVFARVERHARRLGLSRSEFFARAAARWADELEGEGVTAAINEALEAAGDDGYGGNRSFLRAASTRTFAHAQAHEQDDGTSAG